MAQLHIDVVSDVICPWCFLGKRRLDAAARHLKDIDLKVVFRPFFLDATIPPGGVDRTEYLTKKFGAERVKTIHDPLIAAGLAENVPYQFDKITRTPNTLDAHRLLRWSHQAGVQHTVAEALFMAYWHFGQDVSDHEVLRTIAIINGLDGDEIPELLASDLDKDAVLSEARQSQQAGISGVPTFVLGNRFALSGAQTPEVLVQTIRKVVEQIQNA